MHVPQGQRSTQAGARHALKPGANSSSCACDHGLCAVANGLTLQNMLSPANPLHPSTCPVTCSSAMLLSHQRALQIHLRLRFHDSL
jgi:hypothetical protein